MNFWKSVGAVYVGTGLAAGGTLTIIYLLNRFSGKPTESPARTTGQYLADLFRGSGMP